MNDLIARLRELIGNCRCLACKDRREAADRIELLQSAGDALAEGIRHGRWDDALDNWDKVRNE
jgi:hypothetical protein